MNQPPRGIQDLIYALEEGAGRAWLGRLFALLFAIFIGVVYHLTEFRNMVNPEAMDAAQVARQISEGKGFSTLFIRPLSIHLLQDQAKAHGKDPGKVLDEPRHPDLANAPLYPLLLAGWMKVAGFQFNIPTRTEASAALRHQPDVRIAYLNLALFVVLIIQVYALGRRLFDPMVAKVAAAILYGTEIMWRFTYSGMSTMLLLVLVAALVHVLVSLESEANRTEPPAPAGRLMLWSALAGLLVGLICMTRYSVGVLIVPVVAFIALWGGNRRWLLAPLAALIFALVVSPWLWRNHQVSGQWFGTAGFAMYQETADFPGDELERSQSPELSKVDFGELRRKLVLNLSQLVTEELPRVGGGYLTAFFLVGLLIPFHSASLQRLRWLVVASLLALLPTQAMGKTQLTTISPVINSENLIAVFTPMVILFGTALFSLLLDRIEWLILELRRAAIVAFTLLVNLPMLLTILPPRTWPVAYPPYHPLFIQRFSHWMEERELMMSDMPWAVAWYGHRECLWITLRVKHDYQEDFYRINDYLRSVRGIYLTAITADERWRPKFLNVENPNTAWYRFYMDSLLRTNMPTGFPLHHALGAGFMTEGQYFLTDRPRWNDWSLRRR